MSLPYANYEVISLSGTMNLSPFGSNGYRTAMTVHQIYCLAAGNITITPFKGSAFTWAATINTSMDIMASAVTVSSGTFIAFRAKNEKNPFYGAGNNQ